MDNQKEKLRERIGKLTYKLRSLEEEERDKLTRPELRKMVGRCFKYQNRYSSGEPWWLYSKVTAFDEKKMTFTAARFQRTSMDRIEIEEHVSFNFEGRNTYGVDQSWIPITTKEYEYAKRVLLKAIANILN